MPGPNKNGRSQRTPQHQGADQDQELEQDGLEQQGPESEHERLQNTMGNAHLANMLADGGGGDDGGSGGSDLERALRKHEEQEQSVSHGGDDIPIDDGPLTLDDLTRSWNPTLPKQEEKPAFVEPMPDDELPDENPEFVAAIQRRRERFQVASTDAPDRFLQPSEPVVIRGLPQWAEELGHRIPDDLVLRAVARLIAPASSSLLDPHGRVLFSRARVAAIGQWLSMQILPEPMELGDLTFLHFSLELAGRRWHARHVRLDPGFGANEMPRARVVLERHLEAKEGMLHPAPLPPAATDHLLAILDKLLDLPNAEGLLPSLPEVDEAETIDDPLGLDALINELTGGGQDPAAAVFDSAVLTAERYAALCAQLRIHFASVCMSTSEVCRLWSWGSPAYTLMVLAERVDREVDKHLKLLLEIARAAQTRAVPPRGLSNGLKRAARALDRTRLGALTGLSEVIGGILPAAPLHVQPPFHHHDPLSEAWRDGIPTAARSWLVNRGERGSLAALLTEAATRPVEADRWLELLSAWPDAVALLQQLALAALLRERRFEEARALGLQAEQLALARRNGALYAASSLGTVEATYHTHGAEAARAAWYDRGHRSWQLGAPGGLTLLARWAPPPDEPVDVDQAAGT